MKRLACHLFVAFLIGCAAPAPQIPVQPPPLPWAVCFTPPPGCTDVVVQELAKAKESIHVQAYYLTYKPVADALIAAHQRGVKVSVLLDTAMRTRSDSQAKRLADAGISVLIDAAHATRKGLAHNKIMIIDLATVMTGSFNFTEAAETRNAENIFLVRDKAAAAKYLKNWQDHAGHSEAYMGR